MAKRIHLSIDTKLAAIEEVENAKKPESKIAMSYGVPGAAPALPPWGAKGGRTNALEGKPNSCKHSQSTHLNLS